MRHLIHIQKKEALGIFIFGKKFHCCHFRVIDFFRPAVLYIEHLPILVLNFNIYCIFCTVRTPRCKGLLLVKGICQIIHHNNCFWMFMRPYKFGLTAWRKVIENCIGFLNVFKPIKSLKFVVDFSAEIWMKQKLHNTSRLCHEIKSFAKKHFLKKFTILIFVCNCQRIISRNNKLVKYLTTESFLRWVSLLPA